MEGFDPTVIMAVTALLMPVIGAFMAITPYLMRRGEVFTVTVPTSEQHDPYVVGLKRRYAAIVGSATAVFTVIGFASAAMGNAGGVLGALIVGSLAVTAGGYALMLAFRAKMSAYKAKRGWTADAQESVAVVGEQPVPRAISQMEPVVPAHHGHHLRRGRGGLRAYARHDSHAYGLRRHRERLG